MTARNRLVVALDRSTRDDILGMVDRLAGTVGMFKIGLEAFVANGPGIVREIVDRGEKVFLDLKVHDIPNTARGAVREAGRLGASITTVHTSGGKEMLENCAAAARDFPDLLVAGVTVLTSLDESGLASIGFSARPGELVTSLARLALGAGVRAVVASPLEITPLREALEDSLVIITPGIRTPGDGGDDQRRTMSVRDAVARGADYLVIGRPITGAPDPRSAAMSFVEEMDSV